MTIVDPELGHTAKRVAAPQRVIEGSSPFVIKHYIKLLSVVTLEELLPGLVVEFSN